MTGTSSGAAGVGAVTASARASLLCSTLVDTPLFKRERRRSAKVSANLPSRWGAILWLDGGTRRSPRGALCRPSACASALQPALGKARKRVGRAGGAAARDRGRAGHARPGPPRLPRPLERREPRGLDGVGLVTAGG